jgi:hypothetical protein
LLVVLEEFQETPAEELRRVCKFLEIDPGFQFTDHGPHNRSSDHYIERPLWNRIRNVGFLRRFAHLIPSEVREAVLRSTGRKVEARRKLAPPERANVAEALHGDLIRLKTNYGIDAAATWGIGIQ